MNADRQPVTELLAEFVVEQQDIPDEARHAARRTILNTVSLAAAAADHPVTNRVREVVVALGGRPEATLLGRGEELPATWAALVNGVAAHVEDFDDTHLETLIHPGAAVVPAALAAAELVDASEAVLIEAVCLGIEVALRVGIGVSPGHFERGWHPTGTLGHLGASAATARVLGLDTATTQQAMGLAGTQAAGFLAAHGSMTKPLHAGKAAANGVEAALLARRGFTSPTTIIEGRRGFAEVSGFGLNYDAMVSDFGETWQIERNAFKPYACGIVSHPVLDAARELASLSPATAGWRSVTATVNPVVPQVMGVKNPSDGLSSKFSAYHCVAIGLLGYPGGPESFTDEIAIDPDVRALRDNISIVLDATLRRDEAHLEGQGDDGERHQVHVEYTTGSLERPLDDGALRRKAQLVAGPILGEQQTQELVDRCQDLGDSEVSVRHLVDAAVPHAAGRRALPSD